MDSLKHPGTILAGIDAIAILGLSVWSYRQVTELQKNVAESTTSVKSGFEGARDAVSKLQNSLRDLGGKFNDHLSKFKKTERKISDLQNRADALEEQVSLLLELLESKEVLTKKECTDKIRRPVYRNSSKHRKPVVSDSDDESSDSDNSEEAVKRAIAVAQNRK